MVFGSPFGNVEIPDLPLTQFVFQRFDQHGDKPAIIDAPTRRVLTYAQYKTAVARAAAGLASRGLSKGDVVAIASPNTPLYPIAFHAAVALGAAVTTINPLAVADEMRRHLHDSGARFLITSPPQRQLSLDATKQACVQHVLFFGGDRNPDRFDDLIDGPDAAPLRRISDPAEVAALPYSSGTAGPSKGVMLSHQNMVANLLQIERAGHAGPGDTLICVVPLFHIYGMQMYVNYAPYVGATVIMLPRFDLEQMLGTIQEYRVTMAHLVPPIISALATHPLVDGYDLSSLKAIFSAAAPLAPDVARACALRLGCLVKQGYGMTEASPVTHLPPADALQSPHASVGPCVANTQCKVIHLETESELESLQEGEICVRGPQVMRGYLNNPQATAHCIDPQGWLHTGDVGYVDRDGYLFIIGRAKELIKYKGLQVAPAELEAILLSHPAIADAAVVPSPDQDAGEVPKAFIVARSNLSAEDVINFVSPRVAPHKRIRRVEFIDQIPKLPSGKILRSILLAKERSCQVTGFPSQKNPESANSA